MKKFKDFIHNKERDLIEGVELTSFFKIINETNETHKIYESLIEKDEIDGEYLYNKYLDMLDESYITEVSMEKRAARLAAQIDNNNKLHKKEQDKKRQEMLRNQNSYSEEAYKKARRIAIDSNKSYKDFYRDRSSKPFDGPETRLNRNANLTELLPCIWYKMYKGKPFTYQNGEVVKNINSPSNLPIIPKNNEYYTDNSKIKTIIINTLKYIKEHKNEFNDIIAAGNERYTLKIKEYDGNSYDEQNNLLLSLKQDLLLSLDVTNEKDNIDKELGNMYLLSNGADINSNNGTDIDYNTGKGMADANVLSHKITFEDSKGSKITKTFINRNLRSLFEIGDLVHGLTGKQIDNAKGMTIGVRNKCVQAFNIYNRITSELMNKKTLDKLNAKDKSDITLYWSCSNTFKGNFDTDYTDTTSDIIASSNSGKSLGISLKASSDSKNFNAKNYNMQSLLMNMLDFNKEQIDTLIEKMMHALWNIAGYQNIIVENGTYKIDEEKFVKYKKRILLDDKQMAYEDIDKWNIMFNNAIFKPIMKEVEDEFTQLSIHRGEYPIEHIVLNKLSNAIKSRCEYIYNNCYKDIYSEYMTKVTDIFNNFFKNEWNNSFKQKKKKLIMNLFGEYEDKDVRVIVGSNSFKDTIDASSYNEKLLKYLMSKEDSYPIFKLDGSKLVIGFNGLSNEYNIEIQLEKFSNNVVSHFENEKDKSYFFALKDYFENYLERVIKYNEHNFTYKTLKKATRNYYKKPSNSLKYEDREKYDINLDMNKFSQIIQDSIGKMSKVANFPFNTTTSVLFDIEKFRTSLEIDLRNKEKGKKSMLKEKVKERNEKPEVKQSRVYDCLDKITDALVEVFETDCQWSLDGNVASFYCKDMGNSNKIVTQMKKLFSKFVRTLDIYNDDKNSNDTKINVQLPFTTKSLSTGETINVNVLEKFESSTNELVKNIFKNKHLNEGVMDFFRHNVGNNIVLKGLSYVLRFFLMTISSLAFEIDLIRWDYDQIVVEMVGPECMAIKQLATDNHLQHCLEVADDNRLIIDFNTKLNPRYTTRILKFTQDIKKHYEK